MGRYTKVKREAIDHHNRMIECAESFKGRFEDRNMRDYMLDQIEEVWARESCPYCEKYWDNETGCNGCPLKSHRNETSHFYIPLFKICDGGGYHSKIDKAKTQEEFIQALKDTREYIRRHG